MPKRNPFREWLHSDTLDALASDLGVSKTTIREWRTGRGVPHPLRRAQLTRWAATDGFLVRPTDFTRSK